MGNTSDNGSGSKLSVAERIANMNADLTTTLKSKSVQQRFSDEIDKLNEELVTSSPTFVNDVDDIDLEPYLSASSGASPKELKENKSVPATSASLESVDSSISQVKIENNPLNNLENYTYNFRLYMTSEDVTYESLKAADSVILAESGSTGFCINDVSINTVVSPSTVSKNTFVSEFKIDITEPFGTGLIDRIRELAKSLDIKDHKHVPMWLDLRFKGYDGGENVNSYDGGTIPDLSSLTRTWQLRIRQVDIEMANGGTEYSLTCTSLNEYGLVDVARRAQDSISIDANTLGSFFDQLTDKLNTLTNYNTISEKYKVEPVIRYKFMLPDDVKISNINDNSNLSSNSSFRNMRTWKIRGSNSGPLRSEKTNTVNSDIKPDRNVWRSTFTKGTSIEAIIQQIIGSTVEGQSLAIFGEIGKSIESKSPRNPILPSIAFVVDPDVKLLSYNGEVKDYNKLITYNIYDYSTFIPIISKEHIEESKEIKNSKLRLLNKFKISNIKKYYNYMYTGENTEILDYSIKLNAAWVVNLPLHRGQNRFDASGSGRDSTETGEPIKAHQINQEYVEPTNRSKRSITELQNEKLELEAEASINEHQSLNVRDGDNVLNALKENEKELAQKLLNQQIPLNKTGSINTSIFGANSIKSQNDNISVIRVVNGVDVPTPKKNTTGSIYYVEDLDLQSNDSKSNTVEDENDSIISVTTKTTSTGSYTDSNIEGERNRNRSFFSNVMNQIYGKAGSMVELDMTIRGDPYWLGEPNINKRLYSKSDHLHTAKTDALMILTFKYPVSVDDGNNIKSYNGTGLYKLEIKENGFNGVYRVIKVENNFSGGKFTQRLSGNIDPLTSERALLSELNNITIS